LPLPAIQRPFSHPKGRRRLALLLVFAFLVAGFAQAAHYHKINLVRGSTHVHCLLCLFAASSASPPAAAQPPSRPACALLDSTVSVDLRCPPSPALAGYDATGPPAA